MRNYKIIVGVYMCSYYWAIGRPQGLAAVIDRGGPFQGVAIGGAGAGKNAYGRTRKKEVAFFNFTTLECLST